MPTESSSRFSTFEIIRIIVPGMYLMFLVMVLIVSFELPFLLFESSGIVFVIFIITSIVAGLSFYSKETPKKRKAFQTNQPSLYILERSRVISSHHPVTEDEARRLYFYILNHEMPAVIHDKIFFFGMIYHIMINIRRTSFWFGIIGFIGIIIQIILTQYMTPISVITVLLIWLVYFFNVRFNKADRKMQENYLDQIFWLEMNSDLVDKMILHRVHINEK